MKYYHVNEPTINSLLSIQFGLNHSVYDYGLEMESTSSNRTWVILYI